jgi:hypothetical protein
MVRSQLGQIVLETLSRKNPSKKKAGGVAQGEDPEFKPQYHQKKKKVFLIDFKVEGLLTKRAGGVALKW